MHPIEHSLLVHCAPVLCKMKPASIISCCKYDPRTIDSTMEKVRNLLAPYGCLLVEICRCEHHATIFMYHRWVLTAFLNTPGVPEFLMTKGYPVTKGIDELVAALVSRFRSLGTVPHEVGVFLGYPLDDVQDFIRNRGRNYRVCRYWKVYSNENYAEKVFGCYDRCRMKLAELMNQGLPFELVLKEIA